MGTTMNLTKEIEKVFAGPQKITDEEQDMLLDCLQFMRDDIENGMPAEVVNAWRFKIQGIIEFLYSVGRIEEAQYDRIRDILKEIAGENYE